LLADSDIIPNERLKELNSECDELIAILTTIVKKVKAQRQ
jgi:hypothetical protein